MKKLITNYTFDASAKTVNFNDYTGTFDIKGLLLIVNVTDNIIIYNFAVDGLGYTAVSDDLVTLELASVTSMDDADKLLIYYDDPVATQLVSGTVTATPSGTQTVDLGANNDVTVTSGAITATLSGTDNAVLDAMVVDLAALEVLQTSTNTKLDTLETTLTNIETDAAALEVLQTTTNTKLTGIDADTDAIKTAVQILDDWDDSNKANVNLNLAGSDAPTGGGAESGSLRVTIANDSTGVVSIDDGGGAITVDGTVTANLGATDNAVLDDVADKLGDIKDTTDDIKDAVESTLDVEGTLGHGITTGGQGVKTISSVGAHEALAGSTVCKKVDIQAQTDNTGLIAVGFTAVDATEATGTGIILNAGDVYSLEIDNLADIFIDATVINEGVRYTYFN